MSYQDPFPLTAGIYDQTSRFVPYDIWAGVIQEMLDLHAHLSPSTVLELSAGTGSFRSFFDRPEIKSYVSTDISLMMLQGAQMKMADCGQHSFFTVADSELLPFASDRFDLVLHLFDSINYHITTDRVRAVFSEVCRVLRPGGLYIFDFTTPANSINNAPEDFDEIIEDESGGYQRLSVYNPETGIHTTEFRFNRGHDIFTEFHRERPYKLPEMKEIIRSVTGWAAEAWIHEFEPGVKARNDSERIHAIIRKKPC